MDVHKETISISVAEDGRNGPVRFIGVIPNQPEDIAKMARRLAKHGELDFCYEAGGCGYNIYRQLTALGHSCTVAATSMIPRKPGERIKTDRRDSQKLAILHRSGDLTQVWVPDATHEALRDLVRARVDASMHLMRCRQQLLAFLLRHGRFYPTGKHWTQRHRSWLAGQTFQLEVHRIVFQDYVEAVWTAQERRDALIERIGAMAASWSLGHCQRVEGREVVEFDVDGAVGALGESLAQRRSDALGPQADDDDLAAILLLQLERFFEGVGVGLVDGVGQIVFVDPLSAWREGDLGVALGNLFNRCDDLHGRVRAPVKMNARSVR
jgi:hypothetical protein